LHSRSIGPIGPARASGLSNPAFRVDFQQLALVVPGLLFAMVAHEYAHGYAAMKQGDLTAYQLGRLTFNPLKHIDPFMTVILPLLLWFMNAPIFGGAKPVPVNPGNYRNYKRGDIIVSMAGIFTNLMIALVSVPLIMLLGVIGQQMPGLERPVAVFQRIVEVSILINLFLALFNLLPIPPLDGSHVFKYLLPPAWSIQYQRLGSFGFLLLFAVLSFARPVLSLWLSPAFYLQRLAESIYFPYMLPNPFA
jgi:Zn-dependent protease